MGKSRKPKQKAKQLETDLKLLNQMERELMKSLRFAKSEDERNDILARLEWVQKRRRGIQFPGRRG